MTESGGRRYYGHRTAEQPVRSRLRDDLCVCVCVVIFMSYLRPSRCVLRCAPRDQSRVSCHEIFVETHVLLFRQDGIVGLQTVLLKEGIISARTQCQPDQPVL